jgi:hypothetical protein
MARKARDLPEPEGPRIAMRRAVVLEAMSSVKPSSGRRKAKLSGRAGCAAAKGGSAATGTVSSGGTAGRRRAGRDGARSVAASMTASAAPRVGTSTGIIAGRPSLPKAT